MAVSKEVRLRQMARAKKHKPALTAALEAGNVQEVINNLTVKQRRFAEEYLVDFNGSAACLRAGYQTKYPNRTASELLRNPGVRAAIDAVTLQNASKHALKPDYVINKIQKTIEKAEMDNNHNAVLRGCELLARHLGMFIERTEISGPDGDAIKLQKVHEAADAFTSAINGLIERGREDGSFIIVGPEC